MPSSTRFRTIARTMGGAIALSWLTAGANAAEVSFPKDKPVVSMSVPDGWSVSYTPFGLEIESPEKNVYIVADLQQRRKDEAEIWAKKALVKIEAFGVSFNQGDKPATSLPTPSAAAPSAAGVPAAGVPAAAPAQPIAPRVPGAEATNPTPAPDMPAEPAKPVAAATAEPALRPAVAPEQPKVEAPPKASGTSTQATSPVTAAAAKAALDRAPFFTFLTTKPAVPSAEPADPVRVFSGTPSLATPGKPDVALGVESDAPQGQTLEEMTKPTVSDRPSIPFRVGRFPPATWKDQPVDVQIVNFGLSDKQLFLVIQASLKMDDRAVALIKSVKRFSTTP